MNDVLYLVIKILVIIAITLITRYLVPYIKERLEQSKYKWIADVVSQAVKSAEQTITGRKSGAERKAIVVDFIKTLLIQKNISISDEQIDNLIESAVYTLKHGGD